MMGNNFKLRTVLILFAVSTIFLSANFVGAATYDATGEWFLSVSNGLTDGGDNCPIEEDATVTATITQIGDDVTVIVHDMDAEGDITLTGSVNDSNYNLSASWIEPDGPEVTVSCTFTLSSSTSGAGKVTISITEGLASCDKSFDITLTKQGAAATYDATGNWEYSSSNHWAQGLPGCDPDDPETGTATITQNGNDVTLVLHEDDGSDTTFNGNVNGSTYYFSLSGDENGGTTTITITMILSNENSGSGQVTISWTDGISECNQGMNIALTKQAVQPVGDSGGGGGCFIATAAYGSIMEPHVKILRDFRDRFLLHNSIGKGFIRLYSTYSPPMADFIAKHDSLRAMVRISLLPVVGVSWITLKIGSVLTVALMLLFISCFVGLVWYRRRYKE